MWAYIVCKKYLSVYNKNRRNIRILKDGDRYQQPKWVSGSFVLHAILKNPVCGNSAGRGMYSVLSMETQINYPCLTYICKPTIKMSHPM